MRRRTLLAGSGIALSTIIAGCAGGDEPEDMEGGTRNGDDNSTSNSSDGNDSEASNADSDGGEANVEITDHELVVEEGEFSTDVFVEATIENTGDAPSGSLELQADWYDADGNYLDNSTEYLSALGAGETWSARVYALVGDPAAIEDYELGGGFEQGPFAEAEGLELVSSNMSVQNENLVIEGEVENTSGETQDYVEVIAQVYDGEGNVLGDDWTNVTELRDGDTWAFTLEAFTAPIRNRLDSVSDHTVLITDSAL